MDKYITGNTIKRLREKKNLTQNELAQILNVSDKAVSRWETAKGYPDISLIEPLSTALGVSTIELLSGNCINNTNTSGNMRKCKFYVCPICGNVITSIGDAVVSCCGIALLPIDAENCDNHHNINLQKVEDEYYVTISHDMTKSHYISFLACVYGDKIEITKLYPEGDIQARFKIRGHATFYCYCNKHGLFKIIK